MAYSDTKSFDYDQYIVTFDGKDYIDRHRIKTGNEFVMSILPITRKILERNNYSLQSEVQPIPQRYRLGSRQFFSFNYTCRPGIHSPVRWLSAGYIQRGAANYDGTYIHKYN